MTGDAKVIPIAGAADEFNPPLCKDCRHFLRHSCYAPDNMKPDYVNGGKRSVQSPGLLRDLDSLCGEAGNWWEPREAA